MSKEVTREGDQTLTSFKFNSPELKDELEKTQVFLVDGIPKVNFEDKKQYKLRVNTEKEIKQFTNSFDKVRYYVPILIDDSDLVWEVSARTLSEVMDCVDDGMTLLNVKPDWTNKTILVMGIEEE